MFLVEFAKDKICTLEILIKYTESRWLMWTDYEHLVCVLEGGGGCE